MSRGTAFFTFVTSLSTSSWCNQKIASTSQSIELSDEIVRGAFFSNVFGTRLFRGFLIIAVLFSVPMSIENFNV